MKDRIDKIFDMLLDHVIMLWPVWFLILYVIGSIITHGLK